MITQPTLRLRLAASFMMTAACWSSTVPADPPEGWDFHRLDEALRLAEQKQRPVFLYFGRQGCPSCDKTNRESFSDDRVAARYQANYVLAYADAESGDRLRLPNGERITEMELGVRLSVFGTPFFYVMEPDGSPVARLPGYQAAEELLLFDSYVNGRHYQQQTFAEFKETRS